jgi:hypothetical protein
MYLINQFKYCGLYDLSIATYMPSLILDFQQHRMNCVVYDLSIATYIHAFSLSIMEYCLQV